MLKAPLAAAMLLATTLPVLGDAVTYTGTLGKIQVVVELSEDAAEASEGIYGRYFYPRKGIDIPLLAVSIDGGIITLAEEGPCTEDTCAASEDDGTVLDPPRGALWVLLPSDDGETITGEWAADGKALTVELQRVGQRPYEGGVEPGPQSLAEAAMNAMWSDTPISEDTLPYDQIKMWAAAYEESAVTDWNGSSFRYVTDPRTKFPYPRVVALADGGDPGPANRHLEQRHWAINADALNCSAMQYPAMGWNSYIAWAAGTLGEWDNETVVVDYLSPTVMTWHESGSVWCGGAHPYNHNEAFNLDIRTGEPLDMSRIIAAWVPRDYNGDVVDPAVTVNADGEYTWGPSDELVAYVLASRPVTDPEFDAECMIDELVRSNLSISFREGDQIVFGLGGLPHAIMACGDDMIVMPIADVPREFFTAEAADYFPVLKD